MLVLTRKRDEVIRIGDFAKVMVIAIRGNKVKLGIESANGTQVLRQEVWQRIQQEQQRGE